MCGVNTYIFATMGKRKIMKNPICKKQKPYRTLAIIGNGFDLAHNYATLYKSFVDSTDSESLDIFREYCDKDGTITTWYSFEENINHLNKKS